MSSYSLLSILTGHPANLPSFGTILRRALALDDEIFAVIQQAPNGLWVAVAVVFLAGLSEALGQSLVLFVHRISPRRFALALLLSAGSHIVGYLVWSTSVWLVGMHAFARSQSFSVVTRSVGLAYAPQVLGFFILTPYAGSFFALVLSVWSLLATIVAVQVGLNLTLWQALACSGLGWLLIQAWRRTLGRPILAAGRWLQRRAVGVPLDGGAHEGPEARLWAWWCRWVLEGRRTDGGPPQTGS